MSGILIILMIIALFYLWYHMGHKKYHKRRYATRCGAKQTIEDETLNDLESNAHLARVPVYDDTYRINNQMLWMSDYSQPGQDNSRPSLNDDIITPIRPISGSDALKYLSGVHQVSRFGCVKSV
jgi:hypothetical protein